MKDTEGFTVKQRGQGWGTLLADSSSTYEDTACSGIGRYSKRRDGQDEEELVEERRCPTGAESLGSKAGRDMKGRCL